MLWRARGLAQGKAKEVIRKLSTFSASIIALAIVYLLLKFVYPYVSMMITDAPAPQPVPSTLMSIYLLVLLLGAFVYVTSNENRLKSFSAPIMEFLRSERKGLYGAVRLAVIIAIPVAIGLWVYQSGRPRVQSSATIRIQHPTMPGRFEGMENPYRNPSKEMLTAFVSQQGLDGVSGEEAKKAFHQAVLKEGTVIYQKNCRPCHGVAAAGDGPFAKFFRLRPAKFRDPGYIATIVESYAFWRISEGGPRLPPIATPWDSAMPIWGFENQLSEDDRWKALLAEYEIAQVEPRKPEKLE